MYRFRYLLLYVFCLVPKLLSAQTQIDSIHIKVTVEGHDLSEDMSSLSSGNDELILLGYISHDSTFQQPIVSEEFVLDKSKKKQSFNYTLSKDSIESAVYFIIIERDSRNSLKRIEATVRLYYYEITALFDLNKTSKLEEYLGDEDMLIYCSGIISESIKMNCTQSYIQNLDSYNYEISVR